MKMKEPDRDENERTTVLEVKERDVLWTKKKPIIN